MQKRQLKPRRSLMDMFQSRAFFVAAFLLLAFISLSLVKELYRKYEVNREIESLRSEIATLEKRNSELSLLIQRINSDVWQEKEARAKLGLAKDGEVVVVVPNEEKEAEPVSIETILAKQQEDKRSNVVKWWEYFFDSFEI